MKLHRRRARLWLAALYALLLLASHLYRRAERSSPELPPGDSVLLCSQVDARGDRRRPPRRDPGHMVRVVYREFGPHEAGNPPVLLLHGSPGSLEDFRAFAPLLASGHRVLAPTLPGFGRSEHQVVDLSTRAHADYCLQLMDRLGVGRAHLVAFSMGGGVALDLFALAPDRVASLTLISSIGVQELELLGDHELNHLLHGIQLAFFWALEELVPHFGALDHGMLNVDYARNFFDTDQRPFRGILGAYPGPMLILHARDDSLVPFAAAREHHRIVPQSEMEVLDRGNHFILWTRAEFLAREVGAFLGRVEAGEATLREDADPDRVAAAARPFEEIAIEPAQGLSLFILVLLIVAGTFITEDLTCIATGLLIASGRLSWESGLLACFLGIYLGDQLLYLAGRILGRAAVRRVPWKWIVDAGDLRVAAGWFERRGMMVILLSRFVPGTRLPTYLLAGAVRARYWLFALYFFVAVAIWTPLLVGLSVLVGHRAVQLWARFEQNALWVAALSFLTVLLVLRVVLPAFTHRGRRRLLGSWRRLTRWEYWPPWAIYPPVALQILALSMRRGGFARVTAVNPGMEMGGLVGESKWEIHRALQRSAEALPRTVLLEEGLPLEACLEVARDFLREEGLDYPVVLKPDHGQRGHHVYVVRGEGQLRDLLGELEPDDRERPRRAMLLQEYVAGPEFGIFYQRFPHQERGRVLSLTIKELPELVADGRRTVERLILDDERAVCMARAYMAGLAERLFEIPAQGERIPLAELGTHSRGAIFRDGAQLITPRLEARIDSIARGFEGFYFGRFDLRAPDEAALREGRELRIIELNGLTGEATHIYDPRHSILVAWRVLARQWKDAFAIAEENIAAGARPEPHSRVLREILRFIAGG